MSAALVDGLGHSRWSDPAEEPLERPSVHTGGHEDEEGARRTAEQQAIWPQAQHIVQNVEKSGACRDVHVGTHLDVHGSASKTGLMEGLLNGA